MNNLTKDLLHALKGDQKIANTTSIPDETVLMMLYGDKLNAVVDAIQKAANDDLDKYTAWHDLEGRVWARDWLEDFLIEAKETE